MSMQIAISIIKGMLAAVALSATGVFCPTSTIFGMLAQEIDGLGADKLILCGIAAIATI